MHSFENVLGVAEFALVDEGPRYHNTPIAGAAIASLLAAILLLPVPGHFVQRPVFLCQVGGLLACFGHHSPNTVLFAILSGSIGEVCGDCFVELVLGLVERRHAPPPVNPVLVAELLGLPFDNRGIDFVYVLVLPVDVSAWLQQLIDVHDPDPVLNPVHEQLLHTAELCIKFQYAHHLDFVQGLV